MDTQTVKMDQMRRTVPAVLTQKHSTVPTTFASGIWPGDYYQWYNQLPGAMVRMIVGTAQMKQMKLAAWFVTTIRESKIQKGEMCALYQHLPISYIMKHKSSFSF